MQDDTSALVKAAGGKVTGFGAYPFPGTTDFSSFLVQAQSSGAKVLGLCNAGGDTVNSIKQAHEFGLNSSMKLAALLMFINDVHALGLETAGGLNLTESFYWDLNEGTRAFTKRVLPKTPNNYPNMIHAGCYSATLHYLKTVADMGAAEAKKDGVATVNRMKAMPVEDDCFGKSKIREDGRNMVPSYLFEVKTPKESKGPWDYYKLKVDDARPTRPGARWRTGTAPSSRPDAEGRPRVKPASNAKADTLLNEFTGRATASPCLARSFGSRDTGFRRLLLGLSTAPSTPCLSLGLAVIFGMLNIINFAHGALFMMGAFASWMLLNYVGIGYFPALDPGAAAGRHRSASSWRRPSSAGCTSWTTCTACC